MLDMMIVHRIEVAHGHYVASGCKDWRWLEAANRLAWFGLTLPE